jgi:molybdopterin-guanine dinucleotide biosynthesis adapter protein
VAALKHSHHDVPQDCAGTDSDLLACAGAVWSGLAGTRGVQLLGDVPPCWDLLSWLASRGGLDLILVEGGKTAPFPKLEVVRGQPPLCTDALATIGGDLALDDPAAWSDWLRQRGLLRELT